MTAFAGLSAAAPLTLIGCGHMAGAMLHRWLATGLDPAAVQVARPSGRTVAPGVRVVRAIGDLPERSGLILLAVKPQMLDDVGDRVAAVAADAPVVSILAGTTLASLATVFPNSPLVRSMPNLPVAGGDGVVGLCAADPDARASQRADALMRPLGLVEWVPEERFDALTALAGSGPAYLYRFVGALAAAGVEAGLDPAQSLRLARATVRGAARVVAESDETPDALADRVASRGGSTREGLNVLDAEGGLATLLDRTIAAAVARNRGLAEETARG